jgi:uncharacterized membrane protein
MGSDRWILFVYLGNSFDRNECKMVSRKFRQQLRQEAGKWQDEGLIAQEFYDTLAERYQFHELDTAARNRFVMVLLGLGSVLLGLAVITFVAANWQAWSTTARVTILLGAFLTVNSAGYALWRSNQQGKERLGQGLLLLGSLILGANMALMSQIFHLSGAIYQLYLVWSLGVAAMAYGLRLTLLGMLAAILAGIGFFLGIGDTFYDPTWSAYELAILYMPVLATAIFVPLAQWCRSRWLLGLTVVLVTLALETNLAQQSYGIIDGAIASLALATPTLLLWAYQDSLWDIVSLERLHFTSIARTFAIAFLSLWLYACSFHYIWDSQPITEPSTIETVWQSWLPLINPLILEAIALFAWWRLGFARADGRWRLNLNSTVVAGISLIGSFVLWWHANFGPLGPIATFAFNALLAILAIGLMREALSTGLRRCFWGGILLVVLQIFSRMVEYDTDLLFKAVVLFLCGIAIIAAVLWFERYVQTLNATE